MKAVAGRDVDFRGHLLFEKLLNADEVEKRKAARRIVVDEEIEVAVGPGFVPRGRTEQVKGGRAHAANGIGVFTQLFDDIASVHETILAQRPENPKSSTFEASRP